MEASLVNVESRLVAIAVLTVTALGWWAWTSRQPRLNAPVVGRLAWWEPDWLVRIRFITKAWDIVGEGYRKYKDRIFVVKRCDHDIAIIPNRYIDELRSMPNEEVSAIEMHVKNLLGQYTTIDIALQSNLHTRAIQQRLNPNMGRFMGPLEDELDFALRAELPVDSDAWREIDITQALLRIVARVSARAFVGLPLCRDAEWVQLNMDVAINVLQTMMMLRMLPSFLHWLHPLLYIFLPSWHRLHANLRAAKRLAVPVIETHRQRQMTGDISQRESLTLLEWMSDTAATPAERNPSRIAHIAVLLGLGSIHTVKTALAHMVYDLVARPALLVELRDEVGTVLQESQSRWDKPALTRMLKLESFMSESLRLNPPSLLAFHRWTKKTLVLSDGTMIPRHTHLAVPAAHLGLDPSIVPDPLEFDALRSYRRRIEDPKERHQHQFATTDRTHMHFGHGKYACPGRMYSANQIKLVLGRLVRDWEWEYPEGKARPGNKRVDEYLFAEEAPLRVRWRGKVA